VPQIEVSFDIDANGILNVSAKDLGTGKEQAIQIKARSGLSESEIEQMVKDAEANAEADKTRKEKVTAKNDLDNLTYQTEKLINENKDKFETADVDAATSAIDEAKKVLAKGEDSTVDELKTATEALQGITQKLSTELYAKTQADQQAAAGASEGEGAASADSADGGAAKGDDVIDADFKDVN